MSLDAPPPPSELFRQWRAGDSDALSQLMPLVYEELRRIARNHLRRERSGHTLQTTALIHEAYLRLMDQQPQNVEDRCRRQARAIVERNGAPLRHLGINRKTPANATKRIERRDVSECAIDEDGETRGKNHGAQPHGGRHRPGDSDERRDREQQRDAKHPVAERRAHNERENVM